MKCRNQACLLNENKKCTSEQVINGASCLGYDVVKDISKEKEHMLKLLGSKEMQRTRGMKKRRVRY